MAYPPLTSPIQSRKPAEKLAACGFDPIAQLVDFIEDCENEIASMLFDNEGAPKNYSQVAYASLLSTKQKAISDLLRYGYARVSEVSQVEVTEVPRITITTTEDEAFSLPDSV